MKNSRQVNQLLQSDLLFDTTNGSMNQIHEHLEINYLLVNSWLKGNTFDRVGVNDINIECNYDRMIRVILKTNTLK